ncbi:MAG TPA: hypothetical protein VF717_14055 [Pyrinomonadaceae bacterium]|jgi:hypothetical protein
MFDSSKRSAGIGFGLTFTGCRSRFVITAGVEIRQQRALMKGGIATPGAESFDKKPEAGIRFKLKLDFIFSPTRSSGSF